MAEPKRLNTKNTKVSITLQMCPSMEFFESFDHRIVVSNVPPDCIACKAGIEVGDVILGPTTHHPRTHLKYLVDLLSDDNRYPLTVYIEKRPLLNNGFPFKTALYEVRTYSVTNISPKFICPPINSCLSTAGFRQNIEEGTTFAGRDVGNSGR